MANSTGKPRDGEAQREKWEKPAVARLEAHLASNSNKHQKDSSKAAKTAS